MNRLNKMIVFFLLVFVFSPLAAENISFTITKTPTEKPIGTIWLTAAACSIVSH